MTSPLYLVCKLCIQQKLLKIISINTLHHTYTFTHTHTHSHTHIHTHTHTHTQTYTQTHIHSHTHSNTHPLTHSHMHTHTPTHTQDRVGGRIATFRKGLLMVYYMQYIITTSSGIFPFFTFINSSIYIYVFISILMRWLYVLVTVVMSICIYSLSLTLSTHRITSQLTPTTFQPISLQIQGPWWSRAWEATPPPFSANK